MEIIAAINNTEYRAICIIRPFQFGRQFFRVQPNLLPKWSTALT